jgi:DNA-directed RNA polymerase subunit beta
MGSNMQRQAVPLLRTEPPFVGTGLERRAAFDSGCMIVAKNPGVIEKVDANKIVIKKQKDTTSTDILGLTEFDTYELVRPATFLPMDMLPMMENLHWDAM